MGETLEQLVARINANAFVPPPDPTGVMFRRPKMAREFKLPKNAKLPTRGAGGISKYPWDEWFNGKLMLLERSDVDQDGELVPGGVKRDFEVERDAMPSKLKTAGRRRYKVVDVYKRDHTGTPLENNGLLIQSRDMTDSERADEDILRAEEREAAKKRRQDNKNSNGQPTTA